MITYSCETAKWTWMEVIKGSAAQRLTISVLAARSKFSILFAGQLQHY